jgi:hypothetical protein
VYYDQVTATIEDLDEARRDALQAYRDSYRQEHAKLSRDMAKVIFAISLLPFEMAVKHAQGDFGAQYDEEIFANQAKNAESLRVLGLKREQLTSHSPHEFVAS